MSKKRLLPKNIEIRPLSAIIKKGLFDTLSSLLAADYLNEAVVLDLFAGTGEFGFEMLQRGAGCCYFVDMERALCEWIEKQGAIRQKSGSIHILQMNAFKAIPLFLEHKVLFDIIFCDPPYDFNLSAILKQLGHHPIYQPTGLIILKYSKINPAQWDEAAGPFKLLKTKRYGETMISFLEPKQDN